MEIDEAEPVSPINDDENEPLMGENAVDRIIEAQPEARDLLNMNRN
jgi:hypothetical protein